VLFEMLGFTGGTNLDVYLFIVFMVTNRVGTRIPGQVVFAVANVSAVFYIPVWLLRPTSNLAVAAGPEILLQGAYQDVVPSVRGISCFNVAIRPIGAHATSVFLSAVLAVAASPILQAMPGLAGLNRHDHRHRRHPANPGYHRPQLT
jgi:hypothetical protein